jgi:MSHA pilin protein MshC
MQRGFTLIELIMVILMLGILAVFVSPKLSNLNDFNARGFHDESLAFLRFAQKAAIAQRRTVCVTFSATSISLQIAPLAPTAAAPTPNCGGSPKTLTGPSGTTGSVTAESGISFATTPTDFNFDGLGRPINSAGTALSTQTIQVTNAAQSIVVEGITGYVHETP